MRNLKSIQSDCERLEDPYFFALSFDASDLRAPSVTWANNTDLHFGFERLGYQDYLDLIHPTWRACYFAFAFEVYKLAIQRSQRIAKDRTTYSIQVPLRNIDEKYYWYKQVTILCELSSGGNTFSYVNYYHRSTTYGKLIPDSPMLTIADRRQLSDEKLLRKNVGRKLLPQLLKLLTYREQQVLQEYLKLASEGNREISNQKISTSLSLSLSAVNKYNTRILTKIKAVFPRGSYFNMVSLAWFIDTLFGSER